MNIHKYHEMNPSDVDFLVQIIEFAGSYLNLMTVSDYADNANITYQAADKNTKRRQVRKIFNVKWVIDNI